MGFNGQDICDHIEMWMQYGEALYMVGFPILLKLICTIWALTVLAERNNLTSLSSWVLSEWGMFVLFFCQLGEGQVLGVAFSGHFFCWLLFLVYFLLFLLLFCSSFSLGICLFPCTPLSHHLSSSFIEYTSVFTYKMKILYMVEHHSITCSFWSISDGWSSWFL